MTDIDLSTLHYVAMPVFVVDCLPSGRFVYRTMNKACIDFSGLSEQDLAGKAPQDIFPKRVAEKINANFTRAVTTGAVDISGMSVPLPVGNLYLKTILTPVPSPDCPITRIVGTIIDFTAEKKQQIDLVKVETESQLMAKEIEQFIAFAAHDLRAPIRHINFLTASLREGFQDLGDNKIELIDKLEMVALRASGLVADILDYAQATNTTNRRTQFQLHSLCSDIFAVLDPHAAHRFVYEEISLDADRVALQIIFHNLLDNALKYADVDFVESCLDVKPHTDEMLIFTMSDNGKGFEDPTLAFVDDNKFHRGSHLGLLGVRRLIVSRGGKISAARRECGTGTQITFTFPGAVMA